MNPLFLVIPLGVAISLLLLPFAIYYDSEIIRVTSDSMIPTIYPNDIIIVQQTTLDQIKINDIIVFETHTEGVETLVRRVIEVDGTDSAYSLKVLVEAEANTTVTVARVAT